MKLSKKVRQAHYDAIKVDDYRLVAALRAMGFDMPWRYAWYLSEYIAEDYLDTVIENSIYIYPRTKEIHAALKQIETKGFEADRRLWNGQMDEIKMFYGVGPSKIGSAEETELSKKPLRTYEVGR